MSKGFIYSRLSEVFDEKTTLVLAEVMEEALSIYEKVVKKEEFNELKEIVRDLVEAQKRSEERLTRLEKIVEELAEAQKRTEKSLENFKKSTEENFNRVWKSINELSEAQKRTEQRVEELAEAQKRTEQRVEELAEAQKKTEERVSRLEIVVQELAEAQKRTEKEIRTLTNTIGKLQKEVGGVTHSVGHILEDKAILKLPSILKEKYGIILKGDLERGYLENEEGTLEEVNFYGFGKRNGEDIFIIGEGKSRFGKNDLNEFLKKIKRFGKRYGEAFPIVVTYIFSKPNLEEELKKLGIISFLSYKLEK